MDNRIVEKIRKEIEQFAPTASVEKVGRVISVGDGVAEIEGLSDAVMSEMVLFDSADGKSLEEATKVGDATYGLVLNLEEDVVKVIILGETSSVREGMLVKSLGKVLSIPVSDALLGRVVNPLMEALDGKGALASDVWYPVERDAYG